MIDNNQEITAEFISKRFEDAIRTLRKLPPLKIRGYFNAWPDIYHSPREIANMEEVPRRLRATPKEISEMEETFSWILFLDKTEDRRTIWMRAEKYSWKEICKYLGVSRTAANKKWKKNLKIIAENLKNRLFNTTY